MVLTPLGNPNGLIRFCRYAYPPNRLGFCGGPDHAGLYQYLTEPAARIDGGLRTLAVRFEAAYPYLQSIARSVGISDPFDERVVEAYWIGNAWLDQVQAGDFHRFLETVYQKLLTVRRYAWVQEAVAQSAKPHHNFHVFDLYFFSQKQKIYAERTALVIAAVDRCRVSWGEVTAVVGPQLVVRRRPLMVVGDRWKLGPAQPVTVDWMWNREGETPALEAGDIVAMHQGWMIERLTRRQLARLIRETHKALSFANEHFGAE